MRLGRNWVARTGRGIGFARAGRARRIARVRGAICFARARCAEHFARTYGAICFARTRSAICLARTLGAQPLVRTRGARPFARTSMRREAGLAPRWRLNRSPGSHLLWALLLVASTTAAACGQQPSDTAPPIPPPQIPFEAEGELVFYRSGAPVDTIQIEIADTDSARVRGLMQREGLPPQTGMLFVFDVEEPQSFWMANTPLSLDMFFVDADSEIVSIKKYTRPLSPESVVSDAPARFVIETPAGYADSRGITEGVRVAWERFESGR